MRVREWQKKHLPLGRALYLVIAAATFRHSAHGFATLEQNGFFWGALSAFAVDVGMIFTVEKLREKFHIASILGLFLASVASMYTQLLHAIANAEPVVIAAGAEWLAWAQDVVDLRVVILPILLPLQAVIYAFASKSDAVQQAQPEQPESAIENSTTKQEQCVWLHEKFPDAPRAAIAEIVGASVSTVSRALQGNGRA